MIQNIYLSHDCTGTTTFSEAVDNSSLYQCDQMRPCDSVVISGYNDGDCTNYVGGSAYVTDTNGNVK